MTWPSSMTAMDAARDDVTFGAVAVTDLGRKVWWTESRPWQGGRTTVLRSTDGGPAEEVVPADVDARTTFRNYGGRCWTPIGDGLATSHADDQQLWLHVGGEARQLTRAEGARFAEPVLRNDSLVCVKELGDALSLVSIPLDGSGELETLWDSSDFVSSPALSPTGDVAFLTWDHPHMPWDRAELRVLSRPEEPLLSGACYAPRWSSSHTLKVVSDPEGWWNLVTVDLDGTVTVDWRLDQECAWPDWFAGGNSHVPLGGDRWAVVHGRSSRQLSVLTEDPMDLPFTHWTPWISAAGHTIVAVAGTATTAPSVVAIDTDTRRWRTVAAAPSPYPSRASTPKTHRISAPEGHCVTAHLYPPTGAGRVADGPTPYLVTAHGGPTFQAAVRYTPMTAFYTSRGFGVVDVDYRGSTGYGRLFREALHGKWGIADVDDCETVAHWLINQGLACPEQLALRGGSAGGWTTLSALCRPDSPFTCGTSWFGVADLTTFAATTHNFESSYAHTLAGPVLGTDSDPSPIRRIGDCRRPLLLIQGSEDYVVPKAQAHQMVAALAERGIPHGYLELDGEGHGFRRPESIEAALQAELSFYSQVMGLERQDVPRFPINGL